MGKLSKIGPDLNVMSFLTFLHILRKSEFFNSGRSSVIFWPIICSGEKPKNFAPASFMNLNFHSLSRIQTPSLSEFRIDKYSAFILSKPIDFLFFVRAINELIYYCDLF